MPSTSKPKGRPPGPKTKKTSLRLRVEFLTELREHSKRTGISQPRLVEMVLPRLKKLKDKAA